MTINVKNTVEGDSMAKDRGQFRIIAENLCWIDGSQDDPEDLCLHGDVSVIINDEALGYSCSASAAALQMLKTLTENHEIGDGEQMLPCCGHGMFANEALDTVSIIGCGNGVDYAIGHREGFVVLTTERGNCYEIDRNDYRREVLKFAHLIKDFYQHCANKILPEEKWQREGYLAFWNEWERRINKR